MRRRKYRLLHLITRLDLGGAQQNTLYCARHHDRSRFDVELTAGRGGVLDADAERIPDATVRLLPYFEHPIRPLHDAETLARLVAYFRAGRFDVVHTHSSKAGILGRVAAHLAGVPVILHTVHGWSFNETQPAATRRAYVALERMAAPLTSGLIVVSAHNRDLGLALGIGRREQYEVLHSGIDVEEFRAQSGEREAVRRELGVAPGEILVGTLSAMKPQKAPLDFVRAAARARERDPRLRFVLVGDGVLRTAAEGLAQQLSLGDGFRVTGWRRDVPRLLEAMDVFLLTSLFEGLPRAVLQAMAAGVPVVATSVDGTPEVVEHERTGLLVPPGSPDAAAEAVLRMVADDDLRRGCADRAAGRLGPEFDIRRMVSDLEALYLSFLEDRPRPRREQGGDAGPR